MRSVDGSRWSDYSGSLRAVLDEYSRAIIEFERIVRSMPAERYTAETELSDEHFACPRDILKHTVGAAFSYTNYLEDAIQRVDRGARTPESDINTPESAMISLWAGFDRMVEILGLIKDYNDEQQAEVVFTTRWGQRYDIEQMLEHAILHILRHRRQLERWLAIPAMSGA